MEEFWHKHATRDRSLAFLAFSGILLGYYIIRPTNSNKVAPITDLPGPKRSFLLGNVKDFPRKAWSETFTAWQKEIGDVIYLKLPNRNMIVLNSFEDVEELLIKRASIWSGRAYNKFVSELMGFGWSFLQSQPDHDWAEQRKIFRKVIGPHVVKDYDQLIEREAETFIGQIREFSGDPTELVFKGRLITTLKRSIGAVVIELAFGEKVFKEHGSELVKINTQSIELVTWSFQQIWLPNIFPLSRFLPSWMPGIQFPHYVARGQHLFGNIRHLGFNLVQKNIDEGVADFSVLSHYLNAPEVSTTHLRDATAMMYMGGVDTTGSAILNFIAHMLLYPDVQAKIQKEIDEKVGRGGSIRNSEIKSLEYLRAAWKESMRFNPPIAVGVIHASTADDVWKGHFIPKGTLIIPHIAFMLRDPRFWGDDAHLFKPERFLAEYNPRLNELPDIESLPFGFGRRICPGRYMAERNGVLFAARILQAFEILPEDGASMPVRVAFEDGLNRRPKDLKCRFISR
ncbi:cytochrome P450 [Serendipita vermifera]|nr:cytochrome P450 [Serendipita vermifera]